MFFGEDEFDELVASLVSNRVQFSGLDDDSQRTKIGIYERFECEFSRNPNRIVLLLLGVAEVRNAGSSTQTILPVVF